MKFLDDFLSVIGLTLIILSLAMLGAMYTWREIKPTVEHVELQLLKDTNATIL